MSLSLVGFLGKIVVKKYCIKSRVFFLCRRVEPREGRHSYKWRKSKWDLDRSAENTRGHRPNYSLGGKILANREGDYESFFREGEENYKPGYGKGMEENFCSPIFYAKSGGRKKQS